VIYALARDAALAIMESDFGGSDTAMLIDE
jgi:hypothetical protein